MNASRSVGMVRYVLPLALLCTAEVGAAQELAPRAYVPLPVSSNAINLTYGFSKGELMFDPTLPIEDATGTIQAPVVSLFHAFDFFGHAASLTGSLPFAVGEFRGTVSGTDREVRREGFGDAVVRLSVNIAGSPALTPAIFVKTPPPKSTLGASLKVQVPTGQYDPTRLVNIGTNRWAFKPELGYTRRTGPVTLDMYAGVWLFTANNDFFRSAPDAPGNRRTQRPIGALEFHVSYDVRPRLWISADINYWYGGRTSVNGTLGTRTLQANSRYGVTGSVPLTRHQSVKVSYSDGVVVRIGGNFKILSVGWQYGWIGLPFS